jgi:SAM-dependent methyltransferase
MLHRLRHLISFCTGFPARWSAHEANLQALRNEVNAAHVALEGLRDRAAADGAANRQAFETMHAMIADSASASLEAASRQAILSRLHVHHDRPSGTRTGKRANLPAKPYRLEDRLDALRAIHPAAFDVWYKVFEEGRRAYEANPIANLSVEGHRDAEVFRAFIAPYMAGSVLDVGCGPQELPVYLRGFRLDRVAGLDPLPGVEKRRLEFCQGFAEFLPWEDQQFDTVLFATSLDHVLSLEKTLDEVCRVLRPGGKCIVWGGLIPGSAPYEPDREPVVAVDDHHLFHFSEETLLATFRSRFDLFESCVYNVNNGFYVFSIKADH